MIDKRDALEGPAMRSSGAATGTRRPMPARSISTTTGPTTVTTTSASADPRTQHPGDGSAVEGTLLGRASRGLPPESTAQAQPETAAGPTGAAAECGPRIVCQFSCGAASAVATKLAIAKYGRTHDVQIINAFLKEEHEDNRRFAADCQRWFAREVTTLRDEKYGASVVQVFRRERYMKGPKGAPCSRMLKRKVLDAWKQPGDIIVFGYTMEESDRLEDFRDRNPELSVIAPLIDAGLSKEDCKAMIQRAGIVLPFMYLMGYDNANCIGCVKGGEGYWRAIREDFPEYFEAICLLQDEIGEGSWFLRYRSGPKKDQRFPLRDLPAGPIVRNEALPSCSFFCEMAEQEYSA